MKNNKDYQKEAIDHFRLSIIDAKLAYTLFKSLYLSRSEEIVGKNLFDKYFWVQKQHNIFKLIEHNAVEVFVIKILHGFDNDCHNQALTLKYIDNDAYKKFIEKEENKKVIDKIKILRKKSIAHFDKKQPADKSLPTFEELDLFFERLENFYDNLTKKLEDSTTIREQDQDLKNNLEKVLQNLYVGEKIRLLGIDIKWMWDEDSKKISKNEKI